MKVMIFASDSKCYQYLKSIHKKLIDEGHESFFLYTESNLTKSPKNSMGEFNYDSNVEFDFKEGIFATSLGCPIPFIPDYLILSRERWQPEQSIIQEFKHTFDVKIALIEINSQLINNIETRLEMISRTNYPQNMIDIIFDHSHHILDNRCDAIEWDKWDNSYVVGNPCYDNMKWDVIDLDIAKKYKIDGNKKQILFFGLVNMDRNKAFDLLENLVKKCGDEYQIFYKPYPGEPFDNNWYDDYNPKFKIDGVQVIYDHLDLFQMYIICDIHIGTIGSVMYPSLLLNKKVVNINEHCQYVDAGNDLEEYEKDTDVGQADGSAKFWMNIHNLDTIEDFKNFVGIDRVNKFKQKNKDVKKLISECTYNYDYDLNFLDDKTKKDYSKLLELYDSYNDGNASNRIIKKMEELC